MTLAFFFFLLIRTVAVQFSHCLTQEASVIMFLCWSIMKASHTNVFSLFSLDFPRKHQAEQVSSIVCGGGGGGEGEWRTHLKDINKRKTCCLSLLYLVLSTQITLSVWWIRWLITVMYFFWGFIWLLINTGSQRITEPISWMYGFYRKLFSLSGVFTLRG